MSKDKLYLLLLVVLVVGYAATEFLACRAKSLRLNETANGPQELIAEDYTKGRDLGLLVLGFSTSIAGFFGIATGVRDSFRKEPSGAASLGLAGVLAGASLLGVGGWAVPIALAGSLVAGGAIELMKAR